MSSSDRRSDPQKETSPTTIVKFSQGHPSTPASFSVAPPSGSNVYPKESGSAPRNCAVIKVDVPTGGPSGFRLPMSQKGSHRNFSLLSNAAYKLLPPPVPRAAASVPVFEPVQHPGISHATPDISSNPSKVPHGNGLAPHSEDKRAPWTTQSGICSTKNSDAGYKNIPCNKRICEDSNDSEWSPDPLQTQPKLTDRVPHILDSFCSFVLENEERLARHALQSAQQNYKQSSQGLEPTPSPSTAPVPGPTPNLTQQAANGQPMMTGTQQCNIHQAHSIMGHESLGMNIQVDKSKESIPGAPSVAGRGTVDHKSNQSGQRHGQSWNVEKTPGTGLEKSGSAPNTVGSVREGARDAAELHADVSRPPDGIASAHVVQEGEIAQAGAQMGNGNGGSRMNQYSLSGEEDNFEDGPEDQNSAVRALMALRVPKTVPQKAPNGLPSSMMRELIVQNDRDDFPQSGTATPKRKKDMMDYVLETEGRFKEGLGGFWMDIWMASESQEDVKRISQELLRSFGPEQAVNNLVAEMNSLMKAAAREVGMALHASEGVLRKLYEMQRDADLIIRTGGRVLPEGMAPIAGLGQSARNRTNGGGASRATESSSDGIEPGRAREQGNDGTAGADGTGNDNTQGGSKKRKRKSRAGNGNAKRRRDNWSRSENDDFIYLVSENRGMDEMELRRKLARYFAPRRTHEQCANHLRILRAQKRVPPAVGEAVIYRRGGTTDLRLLRARLISGFLAGSNLAAGQGLPPRPARGRGRHGAVVPSSRSMPGPSSVHRMAAGPASSAGVNIAPAPPSGADFSLRPGSASAPGAGASLGYAARPEAGLGVSQRLMPRPGSSRRGGAGPAYPPEYYLNRAARSAAGGGGGLGSGHESGVGSDVRARSGPSSGSGAGSGSGFRGGRGPSRGRGPRPRPSPESRGSGGPSA